MKLPPAANEIERLRDIIRREAWLELAEKDGKTSPYVSFDEYEMLRKTLNEHLESEAAETRRADDNKADADRYRWMRSNARGDWDFDFAWHDPMGDKLDALVDEAIRKEKS